MAHTDAFPPEHAPITTCATPTYTNAGNLCTKEGTAITLGLTCMASKPTKGSKGTIANTCSTQTGSVSTIYDDKGNQLSVPTKGTIFTAPVKSGGGLTTSVTSSDGGSYHCKSKCETSPQKGVWIANWKSSSP